MGLNRKITRFATASPEAIADAAACLRAGGLAAIPTETVYGLAADATSDTAVAAIYAAARPADRVILATGEPLTADFIVAGVGVRPNTQLAQSAGLTIDNGIVVDESLRTSVDGIYAAGDVAHYPDRFTDNKIRVEHWVAAGRQGQTVARNILGTRTPHTAPPFFWSAHYDVTIAYVGNGAGHDRVEIHGSLNDRRALAVYRKGSNLMAVAAIGLDRESLLIEKAMEEGDRDAIEAVIAGV